MKVIAVTSRCIASGTCVLASSQLFSQRERDGVVEILQENVPLNWLPQVRRAVAACPAQVFVVEEEDDLSAITLIADHEGMQSPREALDQTARPQKTVLSSCPFDF